MNFVGLLGELTQDPQQLSPTEVLLLIEQQVWNNNTQSYIMDNPVPVIVGGSRSEKKVAAIMKHLKKGGKVLFEGKYKATQNGAIAKGSKCDLLRFGPKQDQQTANAPVYNDPTPVHGDMPVVPPAYGQPVQGQLAKQPQQGYQQQPMPGVVQTHEAGTLLQPTHTPPPIAAQGQDLSNIPF